MDRLQFDAFSRRVNRVLGRRSILRAALLATVVSSAAILPGRKAAGKGNRTKRRKCRPPRVKCGKKCLAAGACCTNAECGAVIGQVCVGNACECPGGQAVAANECAVLCNPACGECERCDDGACVDLADDTPCTDAGTCQAGVCEPDRAFGCVTTQNACGSFSGVSCPNSTIAQAVCFIDGAGDPVCGTGLCTNVTTDAECVALVGAGAIVLPCSLCSLGGNSRVCVKPVTE